MKKRILLIYAIFGILICVFVYQSVRFVHNDYYSSEIEQKQSFSDNWQFGNSFFKAPTVLDVKQGETLRIMNRLPDRLLDGASMVFFTLHEEVNVYVEDELIYSFSLSDDSLARTPGTKWNFAKLKPEYAGKKIYVELMSNYKTNSGMVPAFDIADYENARNSMMQSRVPKLIWYTILMLIGIAMIVIYEILVKLNVNMKELVFIGLFIIVAAAWFIAESQSIQLLVGHEYFMAQMSFITLGMFLYPLSEYFRILLKPNKLEYKIFGGFSIAGNAIFVVNTLLHLTHIHEYRETVLSTHIVLVLCVLYIIVIIIKKAVFEKTLFHDIPKIKLYVYFFFFIVVVFSGVVDIISYNINNQRGSDDASNFAGLAFVLVALAMAYTSVSKTFGLMRAGLKFGSIQQLAYTDTLTRLKNRTAFDEAMSKISRKEYSHYSLIMLDLNNLKYINDEFGHERGDRYLKTSAKIIENEFSEYGKVYRIGGDEFCAIIRDTKKDRLTASSEKIKERVSNLNKTEYAKKMGISVGISEYSNEASLYETLKKADALMYLNKISMKNDDKELL